MRHSALFLSWLAAPLYLLDSFAVTFAPWQDHSILSRAFLAPRSEKEAPESENLPQARYHQGLQQEVPQGNWAPLKTPRICNTTSDASVGVRVRLQKCQQHFLVQEVLCLLCGHRLEALPVSEQIQVQRCSWESQGREETRKHGIPYLRTATARSRSPLAEEHTSQASCNAYTGDASCYGGHGLKRDGECQHAPCTACPTPDTVPGAAAARISSSMGANCEPDCQHQIRADTQPSQQSETGKGSCRQSPRSCPDLRCPVESLCKCDAVAIYQTERGICGKEESSYGRLHQEEDQDDRSPGRDCADHSTWNRSRGTRTDTARAGALGADGLGYPGAPRCNPRPGAHRRGDEGQSNSEGLESLQEYRRRTTPEATQNGRGQPLNRLHQLRPAARVAGWWLGFTLWTQGYFGFASPRLEGCHFGTASNGTANDYLTDFHAKTELPPGYAEDSILEYEATIGLASTMNSSIDYEATIRLKALENAGSSIWDYVIGYKATIGLALFFDDDELNTDIEAFLGTEASGSAGLEPQDYIIDYKAAFGLAAMHDDDHNVLNFDIKQNFSYAMPYHIVADGWDAHSRDFLWLHMKLSHRSNTQPTELSKFDAEDVPDDLFAPFEWQAASSLSECHILCQRTRAIFEHLHEGRYREGLRLSLSTVTLVLDQEDCRELLTLCIAIFGAFIFLAGALWTLLYGFHLLRRAQTGEHLYHTVNVCGRRKAVRGRWLKPPPTLKAMSFILLVGFGEANCLPFHNQSIGPEITEAQSFDEQVEIKYMEFSGGERVEDPFDFLPPPVAEDLQTPEPQVIFMNFANIDDVRPTVRNEAQGLEDDTPSNLVMFGNNGQPLERRDAELRDYRPETIRQAVRHTWRDFPQADFELYTVRNTPDRLQGQGWLTVVFIRTPEVRLNGILALKEIHIFRRSPAFLQELQDFEAFALPAVAHVSALIYRAGLDERCDQRRHGHCTIIQNRQVLLIGFPHQLRAGDHIAYLVTEAQPSPLECIHFEQPQVFMSTIHDAMRLTAPRQYLTIFLHGFRGSMIGSRIYGAHRQRIEDPDVFRGDIMSVWHEQHFDRVQVFTAHPQEANRDRDGAVMLHFIVAFTPTLNPLILLQRAQGVQDDDFVVLDPPSTASVNLLGSMSPWNLRFLRGHWGQRILQPAELLQLSDGMHIRLDGEEIPETGGTGSSPGFSLLQLRARTWYASDKLHGRTVGGNGFLHLCPPGNGHAKVTFAQECSFVDEHEEHIGEFTKKNISIGCDFLSLARHPRLRVQSLYCRFSSVNQHPNPLCQGRLLLGDSLDCV